MVRHNQIPTDSSTRVRMEAVHQTREVLDRLRLLIHYSPETQRSIEERAGFPRGYLSQILAGHLPLRLEHLLALLLSLDLKPSDFFDGLFAEHRYPTRQVGQRKTGHLQNGEPPRRRDATQALSLELAKRYGVGLDSLDDLLCRLENYEASLRSLESSPASSAGPRSSASLCDG